MTIVKQDEYMFFHDLLFLIFLCRLLLLNKLLEDGNILYRKNRLQDAAYRYQYALRKLPSNATFGEYTDTFLQLKVNFLLNHSRCKRKMNVSHH